MREIITVQLGSYSNFVGAHYWNIQDELLGLDGTDGPFKSALQCLPPEVLMTERELQDGTIAMVPRCIIVDKMGGLGSWGPSGSVLAPGCAPEVVANTTELPTWGGQVAKHVATAEPKSAFTRYLEDEDAATASVAANRGGAVSTASVAGPDAAKALDNDVRKFTDYLKAYLPSRTCFKVPHTWWGTSPFVTWDQGSDVLSSGSFKDDVLDGLRWQAEACDAPQGFQIVFDDHSGFSPIAAAVADDIADSFSSKTAVHFPVSRHSAPDGTAPPPQPDGLGALTAAVTGGLTMAALTGASDGALVVPVDASAALGMPHLRSAGAGSPAASAYEGSYALAAALDAVTLPARMGAQPECAGRRPLGALASEARGGMGPVVGLAAAAPCPEVSSLESPLTGLSPGVAWSSAATVSEVLVLRGMRSSGQWLTAGDAETAAVEALMKSARLGVRRAVPVPSVCAVPQPVPLSAPGVFSSALGPFGDLSGAGSCVPGRHVGSMAVAAQLYGSRECGRMVAGARRALQKVLQSREGRGLLSEWGIEGGVVNDMVQTLMDCEQAYADPDRMAMSSGEED